MDISEDLFISRLGIHIRQIRVKKNISQQSLADDCGIPKTQIGRIERAEINTTIRTIIKISNALDIEPKHLLDFPIKVTL